MKTHSCLLVLCLCLGFCALSRAAAVPDAVPSPDSRSPFMPAALFAQWGRASETTAATLGAQWDFNKHWRIGARGVANAYSELSLGHWRAHDDGGYAAVTQFGFTPTLRYWPSGATAGWFAEAGVGANVLAPLYRSHRKRFSTAFNFGSHIGVGYRVHAKHPWEWLLRVEHFSNADIKTPNPGLNFVQLRLAMRLE